MHKNYKQIQISMQQTPHKNMRGKGETFCLTRSKGKSFGTSYPKTYNP